MTMMRVSIPYERESTSELNFEEVVNLYEEVFQFPTNGKVHLNVRWSRCGGLDNSRFNSLRTGKYIWTRCRRSMGRMSSGCSFNSLRTGKYIWTGKEKQKKADGKKVSIPYERESTSEHITARHEAARNAINVSIPYERESTSERRVFTRLTWN